MRKIKKRFPEKDIDINVLNAWGRKYIPGRSESETIPLDQEPPKENGFKIGLPKFIEDAYEKRNREIRE